MRPERLAATIFVAIAWCATVGLRAQTPDAQAGAAAIMKADRDFNQAVADRDLTRFLSLVAETATFGGGTSSEIRGREAVAKEWAPFFGWWFSTPARPFPVSRTTKTRRHEEHRHTKGQGASCLRDIRGF